VRKITPPSPLPSPTGGEGDPSKGSGRDIIICNEIIAGFGKYSCPFHIFLSILDRINLSMSKNIRLGRHARRRMKWRRISEEDVLNVIQNPDKVEKSMRGRTNVFKTIGERYLKVTFIDLSEEILVITVIDKT